MHVDTYGIVTIFHANGKAECGCKYSVADQQKLTELLKPDRPNLSGKIFLVSSGPEGEKVVEITR